MPKPSYTPLPIYERLKEYNYSLNRCRINCRNGNSFVVCFYNPVTLKTARRVVSSDFSLTGLSNVFVLAKKLDNKLSECEKNQNYNDFEGWFKSAIQGKSTFTPNHDSLKLKDIFALLEKRYFDNPNPNTGRKRSRSNTSDLRSFQNYYTGLFNRFPDWQEYPSIQNFNAVLNTYSKDNHTKRKGVAQLRKIAGFSPNKKALLTLLDEHGLMPSFKQEKINLTFEAFLEWHDNLLEIALNTNSVKHQQKKLFWLSVCSFILIYGLRPGEVLAVKNLQEAVSVDGINFPNLKFPLNDKQMIVIGNYASNGFTTKTGKRVAIPLLTQKQIDKLYCELSIPKKYQRIQKSTTRNNFISGLDSSLHRYNFPANGAYSLRHLANYLGELKGLSLEQRAKSLGHSMRVNDEIYKKRQGLHHSLELFSDKL